MKIFKINSLNNLHILKNKCNYNSNNTSTVELNNNIIKNPYYNTISFKRQKQLDKYNLIDKGYEEILIAPNGTVKNNSKFLIIENSEQLTAVANSSGMENRYFILTSDIDMENCNFQPIGSYINPFCGVFDGNGYSIKNLTINSSDDDVGMFSFTNNAKISNLKIENANIIARSEVGGMIGYAENTVINNCEFSGNVIGELNVGGLVGVGKYNKINSILLSGELKSSEIAKNFLFDSSMFNEQLNSAFGGIIARDEASEITNVYTNMNIKADMDCGGIVGISTSPHFAPTKISGVWFEGTIPNLPSTGAIIGNGNNAEISQCIAINNKIIGKNNECVINNCITKIKDIKNVNLSNFNEKFWNVKEYCMPRLKIKQAKIEPEKVFLEDINTARELGLFPDATEDYIPPDYIGIPIKIAPPKHYKQNAELVEKIKNSTDKSFLLDTFYIYADSYRLNCLTTDEYDEILLALVQNKNFDVNYIYGFKDELLLNFRESIHCHPLYVCSRLSKPYIYREMLKRNDINLDKLCGCDNATDTFITMQNYPENASAYILYSSNNPKVVSYLTRKIENHNCKNRNNSSELINLMNKYYPNKFDYDEKNQEIKIPREFIKQTTDLENYSYDANDTVMYILDDVMKNMNVDINFTDSNGNNLINIAAQSDNELYAYVLFKKALSIGTNIDNRNSKGETPIDTLLRSRKNQQILADLVCKLENPFVTNDIGENAIHIFSKNEDQRKGILLIEKALEAGLSLNIPDEFGITPLMNSIEQKYDNMTSFLINNGADVNICDQNGQSALHYACINYTNFSDLKIIYSLLNRNANTMVKDENGLMPFDYLPNEIKTIVNMQSEDYIQFKENLKSNPELYGLLPAVALQYSAHSKLLENSNLIDDKCNNFKIETTQVRLKQRDIFEDLVKETNHNSALCNLAFQLKRNKINDVQNIQLENGNYLLHQLMQICSPYTKECIKELCKKDKVDVNQLNQMKETPLMSALEKYATLSTTREKLNCIDNIFALLEFNPDINILDDNKQNVLHRICQSDCVILLSKFLELNSNINQKDVLGKNPIEYLTTDVADKMRTYYENYALSKKLKIDITNNIRRLL